MSAKCIDIMRAMQAYAPAENAEDWDNVGLMVGKSEGDVKRVLVALDINDSVIDEAIETGAQLIVTHHPFIFKAVKSVTDQTPLGRRIIKIIKNDISVFSAHTNLDCAEGGTNATLARLLGLKNIEDLTDTKPSMGRIGDIDCVSFDDFIQYTKLVLGADKLSVCGKLNTKIKRVGICTGKGAPFMADAKAKGADVFITGDFSYHEGQTAQDLGLCVIDGTHYLTEVIVVPVLCRYLKECFSELEVIASKVNGQTINIV